jgi:hypothetical protein
LCCEAPQVPVYFHLRPIRYAWPAG